MPKLAIYAAFGVPEVWRVQPGSLHILHLSDGEYVETSASRVLPGVTSQGLTALLEENWDLNDNEWLDRISEWADTLAAQNR